MRQLVFAVLAVVLELKLKNFSKTHIGPSLLDASVSGAGTGAGGLSLAAFLF